MSLSRLCEFLVEALLLDFSFISLKKVHIDQISGHTKRAAANYRLLALFRPNTKHTSEKTRVLANNPFLCG